MALPKQNVVILGAGYGGLRATLRLDELLKKNEDYRPVLVNKHNYHMFMTQLHEPAAGTSEFDDVTVPLEEVLKGRDVKFIKGWVDNIDLANKVVLVNHGEIKIPFKYLIIALGSEPEYYNIEGLKENSMSLRSVYSVMEIRRRLEGVLKRVSFEPPGELRERMLTFVVGGGGLTGVEFAGELASRLQKASERYNIGAHEYKIIIIEGAKELLPGLPDEMAQYARKTLERMGVEVITGDLVKKVTPETIHLGSGREIKYLTFIWAGGIRGNKVLAQSGLKAERGRVQVNQYLQYVDDPNVYVLGDSAFARDSKTGKPVVPTAQAALQQGDLVAHNVYADITGGEKRVYHPVVMGTLVSIGRGQGLGQVKAFKLKGKTAAWLKEFIPLKYRYSLGGLKMLTRSYDKKRNEHREFQAKPNPV